jgi:hypothetical protein
MTDRAGLKGGAARQMPGALRYHRNNMKYAGKLRFPYAKEFLRKWSVIWACALKNVRQPCSRPKKFKQYRFEWAPRCLGPTLKEELQ